MADRSVTPGTAENQAIKMCRARHVLGVAGQSPSHGRGGPAKHCTHWNRYGQVETEHNHGVMFEHVVM